MNKYKVVVFKDDNGDWVGEVNGDAAPRSTAAYSFVMDPDGHRARAAVLREANAIVTAKVRFCDEPDEDLAAYINAYREVEMKSQTLSSFLFAARDYSDDSLLEGIYGAVIDQDALGATIGHALLSIRPQHRSAVVWPPPVNA